MELTTKFNAIVPVYRRRRRTLWHLALIGVSFSFPAFCQSGSVDVKSFGARCDGRTDDTPAIQRAINDISAKGGGVVSFSGGCSGAYYLNSFTPSHVDPYWAYNLMLRSNVSLRGEPGAKLLQGPQGISQIRHQVTGTIGVGMHPGCYSYSPCNGGWYTLKSFQRNDPQITFANPPDAAKFSVGDSLYVAESTHVIVGGILTGEPNIVVAVDAGSGALKLKYPLSRGFPTPVVAKTTSLSTHNITITNLIIQAWCPLAMYNAFDVDIENNTFIVDQSYHSDAYNIDLGVVRQFVFKNNTVNAATSAGQDVQRMQMPMQSSYDLIWDSNTFYVTGWLFGTEFTAHEKVTNNHIWVSGAQPVPGIVMGGLDIQFSHNDVHGGTANSSGIPVFLSDYMAGNGIYEDYSGELTIEDNTIECSSPVLRYCVYVRVPGTVVSGNRITLAGTTNGIIVNKPPKSATNNITVTHNSITLQQGTGIIVNPSPRRAAVIQDNHITSMGAECIRITSAAGEQGADTVSDNYTFGCQIPMKIVTSAAQ
jgi:hypothetical protein